MHTGRVVIEENGTQSKRRMPTEQKLYEIDVMPDDLPWKYHRPVSSFKFDLFPKKYLKCVTNNGISFDLFVYATCGKSWRKESVSVSFPLDWQKCCGRFLNNLSAYKFSLSQRKYSVSITKSNRLLMFREIVFPWPENCLKHMEIIRGKDAAFLKC